MIAEELKLVIKAEADSAIRELNKVKGATDDARSAFVSFAKAVATGLLSAHALKQFGEFAIESAKLSAELSQVSDAFDNIALSAGVSGDKLIASLQKASKGTISTVNLMKAASRANLFGLPMEKLGELMEIARASALATGQSVEYMFDSIVNGIGRGSPLILDNLGLMVTASSANEEYAKSLGTTAEKLTATQQKQAMLNAVLKAGGEILKKVGSKEITDVERWQALSTAFTELKTSMGEDFMDSARPFLDWLTSVIARANEARKSLKDADEAVRSLREGTTISNVDSAIEGLMRQRREIESTIGAMRSGLTRAGMTTAPALEQYQARLAEVDKALVALVKRQEQAVKYQSPEGLTKAGTAQERLAEAQAAMARVAEEAAAAQAAYAASLEETAAQSEAWLSEGELASLQMVYQAQAIKDAVVPAYEEAAVAVSDYASELDLALLKSQLIVDAAKSHREAIEKQRDAFVEAAEYAGMFGAALGTMFVNVEEGADAFLSTVKSLMSRLLGMLEAYAWAQAAAAMFPITGLPNVPAAAAWSAAAIGAAVASGAIQAMAEGGVVTGPTHALIGEAGPEAVIPLDKMGGFGTHIHYHVAGNMMREEDFYRRSHAYSQGAQRGY